MAAAVIASAVLAFPAGAQTAAGGDSVGTADSSGADGGTTTFVGSPVAVSGSSGTATAESSATNTGETGDATSIAISNPFSLSGGSGDAGDSGATSSTPTATNTGLLGAAIVGSDALSPSAAGGNRAASNQAASYQTAGTQAAGTQAAANQTAANQAAGTTGSGSGIPAQATSAADAALAEAAALAAPPAFVEPAPPADVALTGGIDESLAAFSRTLVSEYSDADTTALLVMFLGFVLAAKMARTFTRLHTYWDVRV